MFAAISVQGESMSIEDLDWLTGKYSGQFGPMELEEIWNEPKGESVQALVRITAGGKTNMVEVVVIDEIEGGFELNIQQWDAGLKPRTTGAQTMELVSVGEKEIAFKAKTEGPLKTLKYKKLSDSALQITVENDTGVHEMKLDKK